MPSTRALPRMSTLSYCCFSTCDWRARITTSAVIFPRKSSRPSIGKALDNSAKLRIPLTFASTSGSDMGVFRIKRESMGLLPILSANLEKSITIRSKSLPGLAMLPLALILAMERGKSGYFTRPLSTPMLILKAGICSVTAL